MLLVNSIQKSINQIDSLLDGWTFGRLVIEPEAAYLELETGEMLPVPDSAALEVRNGDQWAPVSAEMLQARTAEGWPAYAGLEARIKERR